jgi:hypothetical protein
MEDKNNHQHSGNGFLLGVIVGVLIALLFTTKRGREIFKDVTEKGLEKFQDLEKLIQEHEEKGLEEDDVIDGEDYVPSEASTPPPPPPVQHVAKAEPEPKKETAPPVREKVDVKVKVEPKVEKAAPKLKEEKTTRGRRWFRGLKKKS